MGTIVFSSAGGVSTFDVATGIEKDILRTSERVENLALSPDGLWLALTVLDGNHQPHLRLAAARSSAGAVPRVHADAAGLVRSWTPDGTGILYLRVERPPTGGRIVELWRSAIDGTPPVQMPLGVLGLYEVQPHPDGRRFAVSADARRSEFFAGLGRAAAAAAR